MRLGPGLRVGGAWQCCCAPGSPGQDYLDSILDEDDDAILDENNDEILDENG